MDHRKSGNVIVYGLLLGLIIAVCVIVYLLFFRAVEVKKEPPLVIEEPVSTDIEEKIEKINQSDEAYLMKRYGRLETLFGKCDPKMERKAIDRRLACIRKDPKALRFWNDIQIAEMEVKAMLLKKDIKGLLAYLSCDANDLTWYELHCEADRIQVQVEHLKHFLVFLDRSGKDVLQKAVWKQRKPDPRLFRNPKWILRSRLVNDQFKLIGPWKSDPHPTEKGTLILLEQQLDGRIYIVGIPITGTSEE
ncbi:hypothetical protein KKI24_09200 [bacterium]|nr:hypothetical protein [bacterium]